MLLITSSLNAAALQSHSSNKDRHFKASTITSSYCICCQSPFQTLEFSNHFFCISSCLKQGSFQT